MATDTVIRGCATPPVFQLISRKKTLSTPKTNRDSSKDPGALFSIPLRKIHATCAVIAGGSFISCVLISLLFDFETATTTSCQVQNYMPSISASTSLVPEQYIWRTSIGLTIGYHYLFIILNYKFFSENFNVQQTTLYQAFVKCSALVGFMETNGLVGLTFITSSEDHPSHHKCFVVFMSCAITNMLMYVVVIQWAHEWQPLRGKMLKTYIQKRNAFVFNATTFAFAYYFFIRHHTYCEPGVYSLFALCEYLVVLSNIYSHLIDSLYIFNDSEFYISYPGGRADVKDK
ncbi:post-GPI attachment to proteins factor 2-like [Lineus longissimus]|uniref:post-GPI attachment to proteins factor 2-like n=1 Tax=Lineus longissimus TaxID=88925 RepID=UPI002B4D044F